MSSVAEVDPYYIKAITALHSRDHLQGGKPTLQVMLEEAIKSKTGQDKNYTPLLQTIFKLTTVDEYRNTGSNGEESKTTSSSDNELELDLLKEDLMCIVCQGMDVGARNRLLECSDCHCLYHQECHQPAVTQQEAEGLWVCHNCKETKKAKKSPSSGHSSSSKSKPSSSSHRHGSSSSHKSSSSKSSSSKGSSSKSSTNKTSGSSSSSSSRHSSTTSTSNNANMISVDKRMQIMKKKAAKQHEKKKMPR